jgi:ABC-type antimicrobial peptide transport system permease subunit
MAGTLERQQSGPVETQLRVAATVAGSIGFVGLVLAAMGVYGVAAYAVTLRTREIAIRISLGAATTNVVGLVLRQGLMLVVIGSSIGLLLGIAVGRVLAASPLRLRTSDPFAFVGATALLLAVGALACLVPVLRASRIDPIEALRCE